jgi:hypothetical protein
VAVYFVATFHGLDGWGSFPPPDVQRGSSRFPVTPAQFQALNTQGRGVIGDVEFEPTDSAVVQVEVDVFGEIACHGEGLRG